MNDARMLYTIVSRNCMAHLLIWTNGEELYFIAKTPHPAIQTAG